MHPFCEEGLGGMHNTQMEEEKKVFVYKMHSAALYRAFIPPLRTLFSPLIPA